MRKLILLAGAVTLAVVGVDHYDIDVRSGVTKVRQLIEPLEGDSELVKNISNRIPWSQLENTEVKELLDHPRVKAYLDQENIKRALKDYFSGLGELSSEEAWEAIEEVEREARVTGYEALSLKLAWLEKNSVSQGEFKLRAEELFNVYRSQAQSVIDDYDPHIEVPGFSTYKELEQSIVEEVQQMTSFPGGMSRHEYLRKRLQDARETVYGS
ncbi:hypothetical protein MO867_07890 [Microbulbifer sp. OS29]|uniref:Uncharacterized protein n=1 Tax=Microbulbifer okhotskensis TaxID=2926617 RepID=A0A9X2ERK4_9GAMM|nr:hypothetical protein [Microbulbifer okhotskensis]MCO1334263.1 hypothetical protein [Microbulbifer okhotskensis]